MDINMPPIIEDEIRVDEQPFVWRESELSVKEQGLEVDQDFYNELMANDPDKRRWFLMNFLATKNSVVILRDDIFSKDQIKQIKVLMGLGDETYLLEYDDKNNAVFISEQDYETDPTTGSVAVIVNDTGIFKPNYTNTVSYPDSTISYSGVSGNESKILDIQMPDLQSVIDNGQLLGRTRLAVVERILYNGQVYDSPFWSSLAYFKINREILYKYPFLVDKYVDTKKSLHGTIAANQIAEKIKDKNILMIPINSASVEKADIYSYVKLFGIKAVVIQDSLGGLPVNEQDDWYRSIDLGYQQLSSELGLPIISVVAAGNSGLETISNYSNTIPAFAGNPQDCVEQNGLYGFMGYSNKPEDDHGGDMMIIGNGAVNGVPNFNLGELPVITKTTVITDYPIYYGQQGTSFVAPTGAGELALNAAELCLTPDSISCTNEQLKLSMLEVYPLTLLEQKEIIEGESGWINLRFNGPVTDTISLLNKNGISTPELEEVKDEILMVEVDYDDEVLDEFKPIAPSLDSVKLSKYLTVSTNIKLLDIEKASPRVKFFYKDSSGDFKNLTYYIPTRTAINNILAAVTDIVDEDNIAMYFSYRVKVQRLQGRYCRNQNIITEQIYIDEVYNLFKNIGGTNEIFSYLNALFGISEDDDIDEDKVFNIFLPLVIR